MITCNFSGNFGNSLTQYVITRVVADKNNYEFGFNPKFNYDYFHGYNQLYFLDLDYGKIHNAGFHECPEGIGYIWEEGFEIFNYPNGDQVKFHDFQPDIFQIPDNTKLVIPCCQDARYYEDYKNKIQEWIKIKKEHITYCNETLIESGIKLNDNLCVINVRGGEYRGIPQVLLQKKYWNDAIKIMLDKNPKMKFLCITDDIPYAKELFNNEIFVAHFDICGDYFILNHVKNLIISNSSFALFPVWLNQNNPYVIAPKYWAKHNVSTGYWASSNIWTYGFNFLDRDGELYAR
jgi:hypothetical protein